MNNSNLQVPKEIYHLVNAGIWPIDLKKSMRQNIHILVTEENLKKIAPDESSIYFYPPPFKTVESDFEKDKDFWNAFGAIDQLEPAKCLIIGDFGLGSDAILILDYSCDPNIPKVKRLVWRQEGNSWEIIASNFKEFIDRIELMKK